MKTEKTKRGRCRLPVVWCAPALILAAGNAAGVQDATGDAAETLERIADAIAHGAASLPQPATDEDFYSRDEAKERLGRLLFHDKVLSGNLNISCATCHHPLTDTGDGLSLPVGEGGRGLGVTRNTGEGRDAIEARVPRNAPHLFNLGAIEFTRMFHDGRVEVDPFDPEGFLTPAGDDLPSGLENVLAAQAMFPVTSTTEMAGQPGENPIADAAGAGDLVLVWERLAKRLHRYPEYVKMFVAAFEDVESSSDITFAHAANAIAAYEAAAFRADDSPFDRYLRGDRGALSRSARRGMHLFYGEAGCAGCHGGTFQTDHGFASVAMPQIGPGKGHNLPGYDDGHDDLGREAVTGDPADRFRFRNLSLRNVALTGPWGHDGAYDTLEAVVRHHLDPVGSLHAYDTSQAVLPSRPDLDAIDFIAHEDAFRRQWIARTCELAPMKLRDPDFAALMDFLHALTDPASVDLRHAVPMKVPSGLPVRD